jgi:glycosyltransferase involved in cell wall biosynthesis
MSTNYAGKIPQSQHPMDTRSHPTVSIAIPVFNSSRYLAETIDSILNQTFQDFEIVITDGRSTDATPEICLQYAAQDSRVHYYRSEENYGPGWNYNQGFDRSQGKYFKWQAHDDLLAPDFLEKCVAVLEEQPDVVLSHCYALHVDDNGNRLATTPEYRHLNSDDLRPSQRWNELLITAGNDCGCEIFGLIRMSVLKQIPQQGSYAHADFIFVCHLALHGRFHQVPEPLFHYRMHTAQAMQTLPTNLKGRRRLLPFTGPLPPTDWWDPTKKGKPDFPTWRFYWLQMGLIAQHSMPMGEKLGCYQVLIKRLFVGKDLIRLAIDCLLAIETSLIRTRPTLKL